MSDVIDIGPRLTRKKQAACKHNNVEVDLAVASLTCTDCDGELDPWWYLRRWATASDRELAEWSRAREEHERWVKVGNAEIAKLNAEIARLHEIKRDLGNEKVGDKTLRAVAARARRRSRDQ